MRKILIIVLTILITPHIQAVSLREAINEATRHFRYSGQINPNSQIVISGIISFHTKKKDQLTDRIETELYFGFGNQFKSVKLVDESESISGVPGEDTIYIKGTYEQKADRTTLYLKAVKGLLTAEVIDQVMISFDMSYRKKTLVAVLDIESNVLNKDQRKIFSDMFREALGEMNVIEIASSADIDKMDPDEIQRVSGCTRDTCATIIGQSLGVDRVISSYLRKADRDFYVISAKMIDIKDGTIITTKSVDHDGNLRKLRITLKKLSEKLTRKLKTLSVVKTEKQEKKQLRLDMVKIPAGKFQMGNMGQTENEKPFHSVWLDSFYIDKYEVTVAQYQRCTLVGQCRISNTNFWDGEHQSEYDEYCNAGKPGRLNHPINCVDWSNANRYCRFLNKRLPTEAEWEKAASWRDGKKLIYPSGNSSITCKEAVMDDGSSGCGKGSTWKIGSKTIEVNGTYDMSGNVWEWVADWYGEYSTDNQRNPIGPTSGLNRVTRGGSWINTATYLRTTTRDWNDPMDRFDYVGFRCAVSP